MTWDIRLKVPFNLICVGSSQAGKTTWIRNLLARRHELLTEVPDKIFLFYKIKQDIYNDMVSLGYVDELIDVSHEFPSLDKIHEMIEPFRTTNGSMIILDDVMTEVNKDFEQLFCNSNHHYKCNICFLSQNLFYQDKSFRTMSLNTHYLILFKNNRERLQASVLARQVNPENPNYIIQSYQDATKKPHSYLMFDFAQNTPSVLQVRSRIFPHEFPTVVYLEK